MKVKERIVGKIIRTQVDTDAVPFGFMPGRGTLDVIFMLWKVHEKYLGKYKDLYFAFFDLENVLTIVLTNEHFHQCRETM